MLVLLPVGLGLTRLSQKFLDNNSVDTASGKGQWKGSSCSLRAHHVLSSAAEVAGPQAGQGRASLTAGFVTQAQSCWEESGVARPAAPADGEDLPSQQKLQGSLRRRGGSTPALPATRGSVQAKG